MRLRHHSVVELVNRMEKRGLFRRERAQGDRRYVLVHMTRRAELLLDTIVQRRIAELRATGHDLVDSLSTVVGVAPPRRMVKPRRLMHQQATHRGNL